MQLTKQSGAEGAVRELHRRAFGHWPAHVVRVPGRIELLGDPGAGQQGLVLAAAVDRGVWASVSPRQDGRVELVEGRTANREWFWVTGLGRKGNGTWADRVWVMLEQLRRKRVHFSGFNAAFHSDLPEGLELGTEASFDLATVLAVRQMFPYSVTELGADLPPRRDDRGRLPPLSVQEKMILARWCRSGSTQLGDGGGNGSDPLPALLGRAWQLLGIDCRFETVDHYPMIGVAVVVSHSGVRPGAEAGLSAKANRKACEAAAAALRAKSLRSVEMSYLKANRERLTPRQYECAFHVVGEIQRVVFAERALREEDHHQFGHYLTLSHQSARETLRNTCAEVDLLVELSLGLPGCLGSRMVGEGFGGAVASLVAYHQVEAFIESLVAGFRERTGISLEPKVLQVVDGTG